MRIRAVLVSLVALAAAASPALAGDGVTVSPHNGGPRTVFTAEFTAPAPSGADRVYERGYVAMADGPQRRRCTGLAVELAAASRAGERVRVRLRPDPRWCRGRYRGQVHMVEGPRCDGGGPCPLRPVPIDDPPDCPPCPTGVLLDCVYPMPAPVCCSEWPPPPQVQGAYVPDCAPRIPMQVKTLGRFRFRVR